MDWRFIPCILFGYLVGGINPSYIIGRLRGIDIREKGSGNAGASNALILMGKMVGVFSALFDIFKASTVMWLAPLFFNNLFCAAEMAGTACILGHMFPIYMKFKGGKGLATLGGTILAVDWRLFLIMLAAEIVLVLLVDFICAVPITACIIFPIVYGVCGSSGFDILKNANGGWIGVAILAVASVAILGKHVQNIRRIMAGEELHFSYLWSRDKDKEIERVMQNIESNKTKSL